MGYHTDFSGSLRFNKSVDDKMRTFLMAFTRTRHMIRNTDLLIEKLKNNNIDPKDFLPPVPSIEDFGEDGKFFAFPSYDVNNTEFNEKYRTLLDVFADEMHDESITQHNEPPSDCPGLWCDVVLSDNNCSLTLESGKNYHYVEWIKWLIKYIFEPTGYILNGTITYQGEDIDDRGKIFVKDNIVTVNEES